MGYCLVYWGFFCMLVLSSIFGVVFCALYLPIMGTVGQHQSGAFWFFYLAGSISSLFICRMFGKAAWEMEKRRRWKRSVVRERNFI